MDIYYVGFKCCVIGDKWGDGSCAIPITTGVYVQRLAMVTVNKKVATHQLLPFFPLRMAKHRFIDIIKNS